MKSYLPFLASCFSLTSLISAQVVQIEPNDSIGTATPSTLVAGTAGGVFSLGNNGDGPYGPTTGNSSGDMDFFAIPANAGQEIIFDVNSNDYGTVSDSVIGLYNSAGVLLASNDDDGSSRDSFLRFTVPADGIYYGVVANWVRSATNDAGSLPTNPMTPGTGRGAPGGIVNDNEVVMALDATSYLTRTAPLFSLGGAGEVITGTITLTNQGSSTTTVTGIGFSGDGAGAYSSTQALPLTIPSGGSATIPLQFSPNGSLEVIEANLEITSNDVVHPVNSIPLSEKAVGGLVFRLPLDEPAGSTAISDASGNGFSAFVGVNAGAPQPTFGRPPIAGTEGTAVFLNDAGASGNYFATANNFPLTPSFTYSLWVKPTGGSGEDTLFNRDQGFSLGDGIFGCTISPEGAVKFRIAGADIVFSEDGAVPDDSVHHIVVTHLDSTGFGDFSADRTRLYIDGVMVSESTDTFEVPEYNGGTNSRLWIGTRSSGGTGFNGDMDEFQLYLIELDERQVKQLYDFPTTVIVNSPPAPLVITGLERKLEASEVDITFNSIPGLSYLLESSTNLEDWEEVVDSIASQGETTTVTATGVGADTTPLFFRVVVQE